MALILTDSQNYTNIANAIRAKLGTASTFKPSQMASAIGSIGGAGGIVPSGTSVITANGMYDVTNFASASVNIPTDPYMAKYTDSLTSYADSSITSVYYGAFAYTQNLSTVSFPEVVTVQSYAFAYCYKLRTMSFPKLKTIQPYAFQYCSSINYAIDSAHFPSLSGTLGGYAFRGCQYITAIDLSTITSLGAQTFSACSRITTVNLPNVTSIGSGAFSYLTTCSQYSLPKLTYVASNAFTSNWKLTSITLPVATTISAYAFRYCSSLMALYLPGSSIPTLNASAFLNMPFSVSVNNAYGSIYVLSSLVASYQAATNWSKYSNRIVAIP